MENKRIIQVDEKVPFKMLVPLSIQHMFAMFGASVLVPFVFGINPAVVLFMNGLGTLLFILITKGRAPAYLGSSFAFLAPAGIVISKWGYSYALGGFVAFNIVGCLIFSIMYIVLPKSMYPYIGMIGGIGVGYSAGYSWQTVFNTFGALSIAAELFGLKYAVLLRIGVNVVGAAYTLLCDRLIDKIYAACTGRKVETA